MSTLNMSGSTFAHRRSAQSRLEKVKPDKTHSELNVDAEEFIPSWPVELDEGDDVEFFTEACLRELSDNPGDFSIVVETFLKEFLNYLRNYSDTKKLAAAIVNLCSKFNNCIYMGVKLSNVLKKESDYFFSCVLDLCNEKYNSVFVVESENIEFSVMANLAYFIGELYVQFEDESNRRNADLNILVTNIINMFLTHEEEQFVCTSVQLLKLVGQSLFVDSKETLSEIIIKLERLTYCNTYSVSTVKQVTSVLKAHSDDWYLTEKDLGQSCEDGFDEAEEPVLYGPDGNVLSVEEDSFLNNCCEEGETLDGTDVDGVS